jgi:pimeloyl-ACP methyl ester carboxylesterase
MKIRANGIEIEVEDSAQTDASFAQRPAVLLVMGLGMQLTAWPAEMVQSLEAAGYRVIQFDNRDVGLSTHLAALGKPNLAWASLKYKLGLRITPPYTLADMAADGLGVLDALGVQQAHVVGVSMGGMIAQRMAIAAPQRVRTLTSIMSTSGARGLPQPSPAVVKVLLIQPNGKSTAAAIDHTVRLFMAIGSPAYPTPVAELRERVALGVQRSLYPVGTLRQMMAIVADITRAAQLSRITCPTLVIHGTADPLLPYACGEDTARRIPGAHMLAIDGMGHDLPPEPVARMVDALIAHLPSAAPSIAAAATLC